MKKKAAVLAVTAMAFVGLIPASPADAGPRRCASWGCGEAVDYRNDRWYGWADDRKTDGHCVELWTYEHPNTKVGRIARSCGPLVRGWAPGGGSEDARGVRLYRTNGSFVTVVTDSTR